MSRPAIAWAARAALLAVFALLVQTLTPAAALARGADGALAVICTAAGTATIATSDAPSQQPKGFAGMPCQDCLAAAMAAITPPELSIRPVAYVMATVEHITPAQQISPRARAPPRPPGQGPPTA